MRRKPTVGRVAFPPLVITWTWHAYTVPWPCCHNSFLPWCESTLHRRHGSHAKKDGRPHPVQDGVARRSPSMPPAQRTGGHGTARSVPCLDQPATRGAWGHRMPPCCSSAHSNPRDTTRALTSSYTYWQTTHFSKARRRTRQMAHEPERSVPSMPVTLPWTYVTDVCYGTPSPVRQRNDLKLTPTTTHSHPCSKCLPQVSCRHCPVRQTKFRPCARIQLTPNLMVTQALHARQPLRHVHCHAIMQKACEATCTHPALLRLSGAAPVPRPPRTHRLTCHGYPVMCDVVHRARQRHPQVPARCYTDY